MPRPKLVPTPKEKREVVWRVRSHLSPFGEWHLWPLARYSPGTGPDGRKVFQLMILFFFFEVSRSVEVSLCE